MTCIPLKVSRSKGNLSLPAAFSEQFPISDDTDLPTIVSIAQFDAWAKKRGLYNDVNVADRDALNAARNNLRYAINNVARGAAWTEDGYDVFQIEVYVHAESYAVVPAVVSFLDAGSKLPQKVKSIAAGRKAMLTEMLGVLNPGDLPLELHIEAQQQVRHIEDWEERIKLDLNQIERNFRRLRDGIAASNETVANLIANHNNDDDGNDVLS